jgi:adenylosuccinate lyase
MENQLNAVSPIDGRYRKVTKKLSNYFSEFALIQYRVRVEVEYFINLCELPLPQLAHFDNQRFNDLRDLYLDFSLADAEEIKKIEQTTNHDVKAVEYFIKEHFKRLELEEFQEFIHFGLTSQDINNTAIPLSIMEFVEQDYVALLGDLILSLTKLADDWSEIPMLARTHGQPASPTVLGKEIMVFVERLDQQMRLLRHVPHSAKFGGATGNFNAHNLAYPNINWRAF